MKKYKIPEENSDLKKYATIQIIWRPLAYVGFLVFMTLAFIFFLLGRHENAEPLHPIVYPIYAAVVLAAGWFIFNMTKLFTDKSLCGTIKDMGFERSFDRGLNRKAGVSLDDHTYVKIKVLTPSGKKKRVKVMLFDDGYDGYYAEGRTLVRFKGLNYPLCLESERNGAHLCAVCGVRTYYKEGKMIHGEIAPEIRDGLIICRACNHTLINVDSLEEM